METQFSHEGRNFPNITQRKVHELNKGKKNGKKNYKHMLKLKTSPSFSHLKQLSNPVELIRFANYIYEDLRVMMTFVNGAF